MKYLQNNKTFILQDKIYYQKCNLILMYLKHILNYH